MKKLILLLTLFFGLAYNSQAQDYKTSLGLRIGWGYGFTVKHFLSEKIAIEGIASTRYFGKAKLGKSGYFGHSSRGVNITGLVEWHFPIGDIAGFQWFVGGGAHIGIWRGDNDHPNYPEDRNYFVVGLDAIGGVQYTLPKKPWTFQVDIKPVINLVSGVNIWADEIGITARYVIGG